MPLGWLLLLPLDKKYLQVLPRVMESRIQLWVHFHAAEMLWAFGFPNWSVLKE